ncbi:hypothetical protein SSPIM334S_06306 [Streptomyces spiroverticillatus]|nr:hypothetical protein [Streptomyces finlayi]
MSGVMEAWEKAPLPAAYLARHCLAGSDGRTILNFAQWTTSEAHRIFAADPRNQQTLGDAVQALYSADPPGRYAPHRRTGRSSGAAHFFVAETGRRLLALAGYEDQPAGAALHFRPFRGLVRPER